MPNPAPEGSETVNWSALAERYLAEVARLRSALHEIALDGADLGGAWCAAQAAKTLEK